MLKSFLSFRGTCPCEVIEVDVQSGIPVLAWAKGEDFINHRPQFSYLNNPSAPDIRTIDNTVNEIEVDDNEGI